MAETLGSLCDKLTIVKLKQWHTDDAKRRESLDAQEHQLKEEIDEFIGRAVRGEIAVDRLTFAANKVYKKEGNDVPEVMGSLADVFSQLAVVNCTLWHEQEKVYEFESVKPAEKDRVVRQLAHLNLQRNNCIDAIDRLFRSAIENNVKR
jgi:hypothetical protein